MLFDGPFSTRSVVVVASILVASAPVFATTIVAIRTPDSVVLAADSRGTFAGGGETIRNVCKIHRVGDRFFAVAGLSEDPGRGFSVVNIVRRALQASDGVMNAATSAAEAMKNPLKHEVTRLAAEDKGLLERSLRKLPSVIVIGADKGVRAAAGFHFETQGTTTRLKSCICAHSDALETVQTACTPSSSGNVRRLTDMLLLTDARLECRRMVLNS
jgi:ATP-dependent protease HslVU (ClpYQ) peptidase subunit